MLFNFQFLTHHINRVSEIPSIYLERCINSNVYSLDLFPEWFVPVVQGSSGLASKFQSVFDEIQVLKALHINELNELNELNDNLSLSNNIIYVCTHTNVSPPKSEVISANLHESLKALFSYFYETTLKKSVLLSNILGSNYDDYYRKFRRLNLPVGKVCLICGLHEYPLVAYEPKAQNDHWLPQDIYPLLGINFNNLIFMCGSCNSIKSNSDLTYDNTARVLSFYPYEPHSGLNISITSYVPFEELNAEEQEIHIYGKYIVEVKAIDASDSEKVRSWIRVFDINNRFTVYLSEYLSQVKEHFKSHILVKGYSFNKYTAYNILVEAINTYVIEQIKDVKVESGALLKKAYFEFICKVGNENLLYSIFGINLV